MATSAIDLEAYKSMLQDKINTLQFLGKNLDGSKVTIEITFDCGSKALIEQRLLPFNLAMEVRVLISDSIDYYQRQFTNSQYLPNEIVR
ncbi:MAG: hypothetical protein EBS33_04935 [Alphaproteobacteria bacterium]|jgi:hypothetical protein|nr:hypothetical protein [Alphaproteobacteria bacterium]